MNIKQLETILFSMRRAYSRNEGSALIGHRAAGDDYTPTTVQAKLDEYDSHAANTSIHTNNYYNGTRAIGTAGTGAQTIANTNVLSSSRIFLTPRVSATAAGGKIVNANVLSITSGASFNIRLTRGVTPTGVTGSVYYQIING